MKPARSPRLVVIGSSNTDLVLSCPRLPGPGETLLGGEFAQHAGGKGANQAVAAARAGAKVVFVGRHGADDFGRAARASLRKEGIDGRFFREDAEASSGVALILVGGKSRENLIAVARSANDRVIAEDVDRVESIIARSEAVLCQLEVPLAVVERAAELAERHGVPFILNPAPARKLTARLLRRVRVLTPNETEATALTGLEDPVAAGRALLHRGCGAVVVTLGKSGAVIVAPQGESWIAAPRVRPVDTVGAGDCCSAWLAVGLAEGLDLETATCRAVYASSLAVTRVGAQVGMPTRSEVEAGLPGE